jgi:undecaprenyl-diphosphatase
LNIILLRTKENILNINEIFSQTVHNLSGKMPVLDFVDKLIINYVPYTFVLIILITFIYGLLKKNNKIRFYSVNTVIFLAFSLIIAAFISAIFYIPRPFVKYKFTPLLPHVDDSSFPSDHATVTMSIATGFYSLNRIFGITLIIFSIIVGFAKVYAGHHSFLDIICSYFMVFILRFIYNKFLSKKVEKLYYRFEKIIFRS